MQPVNGDLFRAQRFAIDFNQLDEGYRFRDRDPVLNESYPTYGDPAYTDANAKVVAGVDIYQDQVAGQIVDITVGNVDDNHVVLDLGNGHYAFYAHPKPGSLFASAGDLVTRGQRIGDGEYRSSDEPHLHFHIMDGPAACASEELPHVFAEFEITEHPPRLNGVTSFYEAQQPMPLGTPSAGERQDELLLGATSLSFRLHRSASGGWRSVTAPLAATYAYMT